VKLRPTETEIEFRDKLRAWLAETLPTLPPKPDRDDWPARRAYDTGWQRRLHEAGYAGINWPAAYGGRGATPSEELIFREELQRAGAPYVGSMFVANLHAGPTLIAEGTPEQQAFHLPAILRGDHVWCQGFSEPEAGSDLASLRTRAVRDGDHYVVTGQKIWTSNAQVADYCEMLVRTDPDAPKHRGITWLIMPMDLPCIDVRPLDTIAGKGEFSEMFLDEVRIPVANRVGAENDGWRVSMVTLSFERGTAWVTDLLESQRLVRDLVSLAQKSRRGSGTAWDDAGVRRELALLAAEFDGLWALTKRTVSQAARTGMPGVGGSVFKLQFAGARLRLGELAMRLLDRAALAFDDPLDLTEADFVAQRLFAHAVGIAAGTSQVQRNIVAERVLGLPKER
jgi:alkylation response protein AidB-like acyl-CoA dehydrogenase